MDKNDLAELLDRYRRGECTEEERLLVESLHVHTFGNPPRRVETAAKKRVWRRLQKGHGTTDGYVALPWLAAAAALVLIVAAALLYRSAADVSHIDQLADLPAGGNRATLMVGGQAILLDSSQRGVVILPDRLLYADSTLVAGTAEDQSGAEEVFNELITPRGGTYHLALADGTNVWLNADSKLTFPQQFADEKREVTLVGEAYFEVAKQAKRPFVVKTAGQEIAVLGTSFNVAAYDERD